MSDLSTIKNCRICRSTDIPEVINLGSFPIPNGFLSKTQLKKKEKKYPLRVCLCQNCGLVQLLDIVDPEVMFKNYLYIPSTSGPRVDQFKGLVESAEEKVGFNENDLVIDIGSNDGSLLIAFREKGVKVLGIDPAENLVKVAQLNGVDTVLGYVDTKLSKEIIRKNKKAKVVTATNVMAHIGNLPELISSLEILLKDDGIFISHFPYLIDLIDKKQFDTIYHEHLSYFSLKPLMELVKESELEIFDFEMSPLDGGSIRIYWKKKKNKNLKVKSDKIDKQIQKEIEFGCYSNNRYKEFNLDIKRLKKEIKSLLSKLKGEKKVTVGYGASARGNIALNYFNITKKDLQYIVDSTPYKQGLYTPGTHIPIFSEDRIYEIHPDYILILAWNFKNEIMRKNLKFKRQGGRFIVIDNEVELY